MRAETRSRRALAALATQQHGVVSSRQLLRIGFSTSGIDRELAAGRLHRLHHGTYAVGHRAVSQQGHCLAAVLTYGDGALLSHSSAAWLWGLTGRLRHPLQVTAPAPKHQSAAIRVHSSTRLLDRDRDTCDRIPVTAVSRTLLDFAATAPRYLEGAIQRAERLDLLDLAAVDSILDRSQGTRGVARLRKTMLAYRDPAFTRSGLERRFLQVVKAAGLPRPLTNLFIEGHELDVYWPKERFAVELDTYDYHGGRRAFESDRLRQEDLKLAGIEMVRITGARLDREPSAVTRRLRRLLAMRR